MEKNIFKTNHIELIKEKLPKDFEVIGFSYCTYEGTTVYIGITNFLLQSKPCTMIFDFGEIQLKIKCTTSIPNNRFCSVQTYKVIINDPFKYEGHSFTFAQEFTCTVKKGVVYLEQYGEGEFPLNHIKTENQYRELHKILTNKNLE